MARNLPPRSIQISTRVRSAVTDTTLRRWVMDAAEKLRLPPGDISVTVIGRRASRTLNNRYRGKDRPTNVLTFPADQGSGECGDILLCMPVITAEAKQTKQPISDYMKFLLQHGCIHLLGLDHHTDEEARRWRRFERRLR